MIALGEEAVFMGMAVPAVKISRFGQWTLAAVLGAIVPAIMFYVFLFGSWDFAVTPPWAWLTISIVPLASSILLFLRSPRLAKAIRPVCAIFVSHAVVMLAMLDFEPWTSVAAISLVLDLLLVATTLPSALRLCVPSRFSRATFFWVSSLFGICGPLALANGVIVMWRAEAIAGDRPYCIQYASQTDPREYEPARTLFDLSALPMQGRLMSGGIDLFHWQYHALLVIDDGKPRFLNWSYGRERFLDEVSRVGGSSPELICRPERHYATRLPIWWHQPANIDLSIGDHHFSIPESYRPPKALRYFSRYDVLGDFLVLNAVPPDFEAFDPKRHHRLLQFWSEVWIGKSDALDLLSIYNRRLAQNNNPKIDEEFNLRKTEWSGLNRGIGFTATLYTAYDDTGGLKRLVDCAQQIPRPPGPWAPQCRYTFVDNGLSLSFLIEDPSQWRATELGLIQVLSSFEIKPGP
jgi:hypothetical protein